MLGPRQQRFDLMAGDLTLEEEIGYNMGELGEVRESRRLFIGRGACNSIRLVVGKAPAFDSGHSPYKRRADFPKFTRIEVGVLFCNGGMQDE